MVIFYLLIVAIYVGAFIAYIHNHTEDSILWRYRIDTKYDYDKDGQRVWKQIRIFEDEWTSLAMWLAFLGLIWPFTVPAITIYRIVNKRFKNKNKQI